MVGFISLQDLNDRRFCSFVPLQDFKDGQLLFLKKILVTAGFVLLRGFNDGWFCSFTRSQWQLVFSISRFCSVMRFQWRSDLFGLWDFNDVCFIRSWDFSDGWFRSVTRCQRRFVLPVYEILMTVGFVLLIMWFWSIMWSWWYFCFFHYKISKTASDGRFTRPQWW